MKRSRVPAETKRLSYERDGVNLYGENDKSSRKAIPRFKAASNRAMRRAERQVVEGVGAAEDERGMSALNDLTFRGLHPSKVKSPDTPLGVALLLGGKGCEKQRVVFRGRNLRKAVVNELGRSGCDLSPAEREGVKTSNE